MRKNTYSLVFLFVLIFSVSTTVYTQEAKQLSLDEVLKLAEDQSPQAIMAKNRFLGKYWQYRTFKAKYRPALSMNATLTDLNRSLEKEYDFNTGEEYYVQKYSNNTSVGLGITQNIGVTGGTIFASSNFRRFDRFGDNASSQYITIPASIGINQPIFAFNALKWEKKIEPIKYEEAKKTFLDDIEQVHQRAVNLFFNLALAQLNMDIANFNYSNSDTLYLIAQGRYNIGTIAEDELLQMQLRFLNAGADLNQRQIDLQVHEFQLRSFLGYNDNIQLELIVPNETPKIRIDLDTALVLAYENNPEIQSLERQLIEASRDVAMAKGEKGLKANIFGSFGYTGSHDTPAGAYQNLLDEQKLRIGLTLPIVDWGLGKGGLRIAQSNEEVIKTIVYQARVDFDQSVFLTVAQFNLQHDQLAIAAKTDTIAQKRYEVTKQRFLIGKIDVLDLNVADSDKDVAKRNHLTVLRNFWSDFYAVRRLTLFDFLKNQGLEADFDDLVR